MLPFCTDLEVYTICGTVSTHALRDRRFVKYREEKGASFLCKVNVIKENI